jgi:hypothetical protein
MVAREDDPGEGYEAIVVTGDGTGSGAVMFTTRITATSARMTAPPATSHQVETRPEIRYQSVERGGLGPGILFNVPSAIHEPSKTCRSRAGRREGRFRGDMR